MNFSRPAIASSLDTTALLLLVLFVVVYWLGILITGLILHASELDDVRSGGSVVSSNLGLQMWLGVGLISDTLFIFWSMFSCALSPAGI